MEHSNTPTQNLQAPSVQGTTILEYRAFLDVETVFNLTNYDVLDKLHELGHGISIAGPADPCSVLADKGQVLISPISHNGVLALSYKQAKSKYCIVHRVLLTNLLTGAQADVRVENMTMVAFYDDSVILVTHQQFLRQGTVDSLFEHRRVKALTTLRSAVAFACTDTSRVQTTRELCYRSVYGWLYAYNVDNNINTELRTGRRTLGIVATTGIDTGFRCIFLDSTRHVCGLTKEGIVKELSETIGYITTILPSSRDPENTSTAAFKCFADSRTCLYRDGEALDTSSAVALGSGYNIVRVFKDVFLAFDTATAAWGLYRITVE